MCLCVHFSSSIVAMSCADGQVSVPADDIIFLSKINSPLLIAVLSQVEARDADGCGLRSGGRHYVGRMLRLRLGAKGETGTLTRDYFLY